MTLRVTVIFSQIIIICSTLFAEGLWQKDSPCAITRIPTNVADVPGCLSAICASISNTSKICKCRIDLESTECLLYVINGNSNKQLAIIPSWPPADEAFIVSKADVNGDQQQDIIIATMEVWGNGMGIESWVIYVFANEVLSEPIIVCDYPVLSYWVKEAGTQQCLLLSARWEDGAEAVRGGGL